MYTLLFTDLTTEPMVMLDMFAHTLILTR